MKKPDRNKLIAFAVSEREKAAITNAALKNDQSVSDYCRKVLLVSAARKGANNAKEEN